MKTTNTTNSGKNLKKEVVKLNKEVLELKTDMKLVKNLVVESKTRYKELEEKKEVNGN
jgi:hypothetical protein